MNSAIRLFSALMLSSFVALPLLAMPPGGIAGHRDGTHHLQRMSEKLQLTEDQKTQVEAIFENHRQVMKPLMQQTRESRKALHNSDPAELSDKEIGRVSEERGRQTQAMTRQKLETRRAFYRVLTPEQREQLKQIHAQRHERMKERFHEKQEARKQGME